MSSSTSSDGEMEYSAGDPEASSSSSSPRPSTSAGGGTLKGRREGVAPESVLHRLLEKMSKKKDELGTQLAVLREEKKILEKEDFVEAAILATQVGVDLLNWTDHILAMVEDHNPERTKGVNSRKELEASIGKEDSEELLQQGAAEGHKPSTSAKSEDLSLQEAIRGWERLTLQSFVEERPEHPPPEREDSPEEEEAGTEVERRDGDGCPPEPDNTSRR